MRRRSRIEGGLIIEVMAGGGIDRSLGGRDRMVDVRVRVTFEEDLAVKRG